MSLLLLLSKSRTGTAPGAETTVICQLESGAATGNASAQGWILSAGGGYQIEAGQASGSAETQPQTLVFTADLRSGAATGSTRSQQSHGRYFSYPETISVNAKASGALLQARAELIASHAIASAMAPGALIQAVARLQASKTTATSYTKARLEDEQIFEFMAEWL